MKKSIVLLFGFLIAATAAFCIPKEFKEVKVKPVIEQIFSVHLVAPVIVDQINLNTLDVSPGIVTFENAIIEKELTLMQPEYQWHRISRSNFNGKAKEEKIFIKNVIRVNKLPDRK